MFSMFYLKVMSLLKVKKGFVMKVLEACISARHFFSWLSIKEI